MRQAEVLKGRFKISQKPFKRGFSLKTHALEVIAAQRVTVLESLPTIDRR